MRFCCISLCRIVWVRWPGTNQELGVQIPDSVRCAWSGPLVWWDTRLLTKGVGACNSAWCQSRSQQWRVPTMVEMKGMPLNATCGVQNLHLSSNQVHLQRRRFRRSWMMRITNTNLQLPTWDANREKDWQGLVFSQTLAHVKFNSLTLFGDVIVFWMKTMSGHTRTGALCTESVDMLHPPLTRNLACIRILWAQETRCMNRGMLTGWRSSGEPKAGVNLKSTSTWSLHQVRS